MSLEGPHKDVRGGFGSLNAPNATYNRLLEPISDLDPSIDDGERYAAFYPDMLVNLWGWIAERVQRLLHGGDRNRLANTQAPVEPNEPQ